MKRSTNKCPVCKKELQHSKYLNYPCKIAGDKKMSYVDSVCNNVSELNERPKGYPLHTFFQVTSLYGDCLQESVLLLNPGIEVSVNYITQVSTITYFPRNNYQNSVFKESDKVVLEGRLLQFDYPKLEKIINKVKTMALFL